MRHWVAAARLRTLPLAFASIALGNFLAASMGHFNPVIFALSLLTTLCYQILSNYANDLGDGLKGTDRDRQGERRAVASGDITPRAMRRAVWLMALVSFLSGTTLSIYATRQLPWLVTLTFILLGLLAILAAIYYTVGKKAYGYAGLGDLAVYIFFGLVGVGGAYFLQTNVLHWEILLPASAMGFLSMAVLNLNNMRDIKSDLAAGKNTLAVRLGLSKAKAYHAILLILAFDGAFLYNRLEPTGFGQNAYFLCLPLLVIHLMRVLKAQEPKDFEPMLKFLALTTLLFALLFGAGKII